MDPIVRSGNGNLGGRVLSESNVSSLKRTLNRANIDVLDAAESARYLDGAAARRGVDPSQLRAGFRIVNGRGTLYLREGATRYEALHEVSHALHHKRLQQVFGNTLGSKIYIRLPSSVKESRVFQRLRNPNRRWTSFTEAERIDAVNVFNRARAGQYFWD